ncbi:MAG TPA: hypothetical protein PLV91_00105 [Verrucomicrobiota bacterium]|nr:hypothetical protein [Verrucomicrobiota bacterium]
MTRFTKADLDSEAYTQKLNQMLWGRCKAGKITQTEYTALVENRDINLKRLIAEKNLTLSEARQVRCLVMEWHLTMTVAVAVAKKKMTLAEARRVASESGARGKENRRQKPKLPCKPSCPGRSKKEAAFTKRAENVSQKKVVVATSYAQRDQGVSTGEGKYPGLKKSSLQGAKRNQPILGKHSKGCQKGAQRKEQVRTQQPRGELVKKTRQNLKESKLRHRPQAELRPPSRPHVYKKQSMPSKPQAQRLRPQLFRPQKLHDPREQQCSREESFAEVQGSEVDYNRTCRESASAAREWRDWREERNIQIRNKQTGKVLPPIPLGQDWRPGMGFFPASEGVENLKVSKSPQQTGSESFLSKTLPYEQKVVAPLHKTSDFKKQILPGQKDSSAPVPAAGPIQNSGLKPKQQRRVFGKARRFVPRKGVGKRPAF